MSEELNALRGVQARFADPLSWVSGFDVGPLIEAVQKDDVVPTVWELSNGDTVLLNLTPDPITLDGPGGVNLFTGEEAPAGSRELSGFDAEIWHSN